MNKQFLRTATIATTIGTGIVGTLVGASRLAANIQARQLDTFTSKPTQTYTEALDLLAQLQARDDNKINPLCHTQLLTHGHKTARVIVLLHGITNCPRQYIELAPLFYELGYNVFIPRLPHNGLADRKTADISNLTAPELRDFSNMVVDIATGLGEHVTVAGLSAGGVAAAWIAQHRPEVNKVALIAPSFGIGRVGITRTTFTMQAFTLLPNILTHNIQPFNAAPDHAYLGYSTRALAEVMRLGASVYKHAQLHKPAVQSVVLISNQHDPAVAEEVTWHLINAWRHHGLEHFHAYQFPDHHKLNHDIIDPQQPDQNTDLVYPVLIEQIAGSSSRQEHAPKQNSATVDVVQ